MSHIGRVWLLYIIISINHIGIRPDGIADLLSNVLQGNNSSGSNNTLVVNPYATQVKMMESIVLCSYNEKQLTFINETLSADMDLVKMQYSAYEDANVNVTAWVAVQQISGEWGYSYLDVEKKTTTEYQYYISSRAAAINRVKSNQPVDFNQIHRYACANIDIRCPNRLTTTPWRYFEGQCLASPVLDENSGKTACQNSNSSLLTVNYDLGEGGRLYSFLAGWYCKLNPNNLIKTKDVTIYSCNFTEEEAGKCTLY